MRVAVFSDVHADLKRLSAVCADIAAAGIGEVWCLGDFASGGGREPAACFDLTMSTASVVLAGNHEQFVTEQVWLILDGGWARYARLASADLGPERVGRVKLLQPYVSIPELGVELVHGSFEDPWSGFVHDTADAESTLQLAEQSLVLVGHTHVAAHFRDAGDGGTPESRRIELDREEEIDRPSVLNPGAGLDERWLELELGAGHPRAIWHRVD